MFRLQRGFSATINKGSGLIGTLKVRSRSIAKIGTHLPILAIFGTFFLAVPRALSQGPVMYVFDPAAWNYVMSKNISVPSQTDLYWDPETYIAIGLWILALFPTVLLMIMMRKINPPVERISTEESGVGS